MNPPEPDLLNKILAYENGQMTEPEIIEMYQQLLDTDLIVAMQGHYQRYAAILIEDGLIKERTG
jgi:hypothetical protein